MRSFTTALASLFLVVPILTCSCSSLHPVEEYQGRTSGRHIVKLKDGSSKVAILQRLRDTNPTITHDWDLIHGFAGYFGAGGLMALRESSAVESISEDGVVQTFATQHDAPWGLARISRSIRLSSQDTSALTYNYTYGNPAGVGTDIYIIDTGIYIKHHDFGGRASWGATFGGYNDTDGSGHGTHVAGTAVGHRFGVAKGAHVIAVKCLDDEGSGYVADIVSALNWVNTAVKSTGRPSIASMSLGGEANTALDKACTALTNAGVHVTVAAGNLAIDAGNTSPARAPGVVTVGASSISDERAWFSNYGSVVDVFAPGVFVTSAGIGGTTATLNMSGTSMSTPHVAGLIAYIISKAGNLSPSAMSEFLKNKSVHGILTDIPKGTLNNLIQNRGF